MYQTFGFVSFIRDRQSEAEKKRKKSQEKKYATTLCSYTWMATFPSFNIPWTRMCISTLYE